MEMIQKIDKSEEVCSSQNPAWLRRSLRYLLGIQTAPCTLSYCWLSQDRNELLEIY